MLQSKGCKANRTGSKVPGSKGVRLLKGLNITLTILHVLFSIGLTVTVLAQSGKSAGLSGAIAGGAEQAFGKKKGLDEILARISTGFAIAFVATSLALTFLAKRFGA